MSNKWTAIYTPTSANRGTLNVKGQVLSVGGETFSLQKQSAEKKPGILVLAKNTTSAPGRFHNDLAMPAAVSYEEEVFATSYSNVLIVPDEISIPVTQASTDELKLSTVS